jgi:hypothetical protein
MLKRAVGISVETTQYKTYISEDGAIERSLRFVGVMNTRLSIKGKLIDKDVFCEIMCRDPKRALERTNYSVGSSYPGVVIGRVTYNASRFNKDRELVDTGYLHFYAEINDSLF